jgi:hypothetical protein
MKVYGSCLLIFIFLSCVSSRRPDSEVDVFSSVEGAVVPVGQDAFHRVGVLFHFETFLKFLQERAEGLPGDFPPYCTATLLQEDLILTAFHCVGDVKTGKLKYSPQDSFIFSKAKEIDYLEFFQKPPKGTSKFQLSEVYVPVVNEGEGQEIMPDLALLRTMNKLSGAMTESSADMEIETKKVGGVGDHVFVLGYGCESISDVEPDPEEEVESVTLRLNQVELRIESDNSTNRKFEIEEKYYFTTIP